MKLGSILKSAMTLALLAGLCLSLAAPAVAGDKGKVDLIYVEWSSEVASTNVVKAVLENMGYDVELTPVSAAAMWQGVASGDADGLVAAWLPTTHGHYLKKVSGKVVDLGPNLKGTKIGWVVPDYVSVNSIADLNKYGDKFDWKIIGIDPGAGLMSKSEKAMKAYGLDKWELVEGSGATMTAALADAVKNKKWVIVTGWTPHWKFARWKLKYLKDPKDIFGGEEEIHTIVRKGLEKDKPEVYYVLDHFQWTPEDMAELMVWNTKKGSDPYKNAQRWVKEHPDKVKAWMPKK